MNPVQELEQVWRVRTTLARQRLDECVQELERLTAEGSRGHSRDGDEAIRQARIRESVALDEYRRTLQTYTHLILWGRIPEEPRS